MKIKSLRKKILDQIKKVLFPKLIKMWGAVWIFIVVIILILLVAWAVWSSIGGVGCNNVCKPRNLVPVVSEAGECGGSWWGFGLLFVIFIIILIGVFCFRGGYGGVGAGYASADC